MLVYGRDAMFVLGTEILASSVKLNALLRTDRLVKKRQDKVIISKMSTSDFPIVLGMLLLLAVPTLTQITNNASAFSAELFSTISEENINRNVIISPVSIRTCLALAFIGAEGTTADELREGLHLGDNIKQVAEHFQDQLSKMQKSYNSTLTFANRFYISDQYQIYPIYNHLAEKFFNSSAKHINFAAKANAADKINNWIALQTEHRIREIIGPYDIGSNTAFILVNSLYFKAEWWNTFKRFRTAQKDFFLSKTNSKIVDMMYQEEKFAYAELPKLDAKALVLKFVGTDVRMLIVLPNQLDGLGQLEGQLKNVDLTELLRSIQLLKDVRLTLPKFKIEFDVQLKPVLETLGMRELFSAKANFSRIFKDTNDRVAVSEIRHKAFIQIDENGAEVAAATTIRFTPLSAAFSTAIYDFNVDHPFFFAFLDMETIYFIGHVADI